MKSNNNSSSESHNAPRVLSPTLRSGPRQRPSDASTDEIVRFVREHQRRGHPQLLHHVNGMKSRAVLPGIERKWPRAAPQAHDTKRWSINEEEYRDSFDSNSSKTDVGNNATDSRVCGSSFEPETVGRGSLQLDHRNDAILSDRFNNKKRHVYQNWSELDVEGRDFQNDYDRERNSKRDLDLDTFLEGSNGPFNVGKRPNNARNIKRGSIKTISELQDHYSNFRTTSLNQPSRQVGSLRPLALRQLPPITHQSSNDPWPRPSRPSAPSPVDLLPEYRVDSSDESESYEDVEDEEDVEEDNEDNLLDIVEDENSEHSDSQVKKYT